MFSLHSNHHAARTANWLCSVAACLGLLMPVMGQASTQPISQVKSSPSPSIPSLGSIQQALLNQDYSVEQLRRFRDETGNLVTVREQLQVDANGTVRPDFELTFLNVEGEPAGSALNLEWQQAYARFGTLFVRQGSFQVRDNAKASANYTLHDYGQVIRAGRVARRMVVFPNSVDKAIWVVDIDSVTSVPLLIAEFDNLFRMRANIEVLTFTSSVAAITPTVPSFNVTAMADYAAAESFLGDPSGLVDPDVMVTPEYSLESVEVYDDPINGRQKLVMCYSDGIDQFMVVQTLNSPDPFATLPSSNGGSHTIGRFRDAALSALVFWDDQIAFHVGGRGSLKRLDQVASRIYLQALNN